MNFNRTITIGTKTISDTSPVFIIAEAGVNHNGDMVLAKELIDIAADANVDAIKFQTFNADHLILPHVAKAQYQQTTTNATESQYDMLRRLEISREQNIELKYYSEGRGLIFLTTPFDEWSLDQLDSLNLAAYKIASTDTTNLPFLRKVARKGKPILLSTGMSYLSELTIALKTLRCITADVIVLQCTANYPARNEDANLMAISTLRQNFDMLIGYSDHTWGIGASPFAIPLGAKVVEKHFTKDPAMVGPDHKASLSPEELVNFVKAIRKAEEYLGCGEKMPALAEIETRKSLQKCLVFARPMSQGEIIRESDLVAKRTGGEGISPIYFDRIIGTRCQHDYAYNDLVEIP